MTDHRSQSVDPGEIAKFERMADDWWDPDSKFKPLHKFNPIRLTFIRDHICAQFQRDPTTARPYDGLQLLDIGCGGGLLCEPAARLGAEVTGIDPSQTNIEIARVHAQKSGLDIDYRAVTAEELAAQNQQFDIVLAMEVVEHVADLDVFVGASISLLRPGGLIIIATINRTRKAFVFAIMVAERILRWLPAGTHDYEKLVRPSELKAALENNGAHIKNLAGMVYNPIADKWSISDDTSVNYAVVASRKK